MKFFDCEIENFVKIKETDNLIDFPESKVHIHLYVATNDNIIVYYRTIFSFNFLPNEKKMEKIQIECNHKGKAKLYIDLLDELFTLFCKYLYFKK